VAGSENFRLGWEKCLNIYSERHFFYSDQIPGESEGVFLGSPLAFEGNFEMEMARFVFDLHHDRLDHTELSVRDFWRKNVFSDGTS
jgi:hypothetical protein